MDRRSIERALAETIFKEEQHLDPTGAVDFNAEDFGFSKLDGRQQAFYLTLADWIYCWLCSTGWTPPADKGQ